MAVVVLKNFPPLQTLKLTSRELMREVGLLARERILARTQAGKDMHGQPFAPYSQRYAQQKGKELGKTSVNLQVSGGMLNALGIIEVGDDYVEVGIKV